MVELKSPNPPVRLFAKLEGNNPAGSVKDRPAYSMIYRAQQRGDIQPGDTLIEATSGNTGIALAMAAAVLGYRMVLIMPAHMSAERRASMKAYGAEIIPVSQEAGMEGARDLAERMAREGKGKVLDQFANPDNWRAHYEGTGPEIWRDTDGQVDALVAGVGTGGTISGISRYIKQTEGKAITTVAVEPASSTMINNTLAGEEPTHAPHKIQGIGAGFIPGNMEEALVDEVLTIGNETAFETARRAARTEGLPCGISSGAAIAAALELGARPDMKGKQIVVIIPSFAERFLSAALLDGLG